jgi:2,3-bisphosphoglycerate-independent phosphoglycerate mutase
VIIGAGLEGRPLHDGRLADVAPTICAILGLPPGPQMTGRNLLGTA